MNHCEVCGVEIEEYADLCSKHALGASENPRRQILAALILLGQRGDIANGTTGALALLEQYEATLRPRPPKVSTEWFRIVADIKVCPKCWAPLAILSDQSAGTYDYQAKDHICVDAAELREAAEQLVAALDRCKSTLDGLAVLAHVHGQRYDGPTFGKEWERLREALWKSS